MCEHGDSSFGPVFGGVFVGDGQVNAHDEVGRVSGCGKGSAAHTSFVHGAMVSLKIINGIFGYIWN